MSDQKKFDDFIALFKKHNNFDQHEELSFSINSPGDILYRLTISNKHLSSPGVSHGGTLAAMMDATLGLAALSAAFIEEKVCSTVEFKINYLGPAHLGDQLEGHGTLVFKGSSLIVSTADIRNIETGKLIAKGMGTFNLFPFAKKAKLYENSQEKS